MGLFLITPMYLFKLPTLVIVSGNLIFEFFLTIFNIHFFSMVQKKVPNEMLGRVFSTIFTVAVLLMPLSTALMTAVPFSVNVLGFAVIGSGVIIMSLVAYVYSKIYIQ